MFHRRYGLFAAGLSLLLVAVAATGRAANVTIDFEDLSLPGAGSYQNGSGGGGDFTSGGATFNNTFTDFGGGYITWAGWAYSNVQDNTTPDFSNQYASFATPAGGDASSQYAIGYDDSYFSGVVPRIALPAGYVPSSARITNNTYGAQTMLNGNFFAKKFGGPNGTDPDYLRMTISGRDGLGQLTGSTVFYLADYRFASSAQDYVVSDWTSVDLGPLSLLGHPTLLEFSLASSDNDPVFGPNTPLYFAMDNLVLTAAPEPASWLLAGVGLGCLAVCRRRWARG